MAALLAGAGGPPGRPLLVVLVILRPSVAATLHTLSLLEVMVGKDADC